MHGRRDHARCSASADTHGSMSRDAACQQIMVIRLTMPCWRNLKWTSGASSVNRLKSVSLRCIDEKSLHYTGLHLASPSSGKSFVGARDKNSSEVVHVTDSSNGGEVLADFDSKSNSLLFKGMLIKLGNALSVVDKPRVPSGLCSRPAIVSSATSMLNIAS